MTLRFENVEKHHQNTRIVPPLSLTVPAGEITALHASIDARAHLLHLLEMRDASGTGEVYINDAPLRKQKGSYLPEVGISLMNEGYYERITVKSNMIFYKKLFQSDASYKEAAAFLHLEEKMEEKVQHMSFSEKRRLLLARLFFQDPSILVLEEPDQNIDIESKRILQQVLVKWKKEGKAVLLLMSNMESAITLADSVYKLTPQGISLVETKGEAAEKDEEEEASAFSFSKIPTRVEEKIVLFDPPEIDYIESQEGKSILYVKNEGFPCSFTLVELEEKLHSFGFFRCHRSYIVNLQKVKEVITWTRNSYSLQLDDHKKSEIPLSKGKMEDLKKMLGLK